MCYHSTWAVWSTAIRSGDFFLVVDAQSNFEGFDRQPRDSEINPAARKREMDLVWKDGHIVEQKMKP